MILQVCLSGKKGETLSPVDIPATLTVCFMKNHLHVLQCPP